jgi:hypothetical protein
MPGVFCLEVDSTLKKKKMANRVNPPMGRLI